MKKLLVLIPACLFVSFQFVISQSILEDNYDVKQYILDLQLSNISTRLSGNVTMRATVAASTMDTLVVELNDSVAVTTFMVVDSVALNGNPAEFLHTNSLVSVPLSTPMHLNDQFILQIWYHGNGSGGSIAWGYGIVRQNYSGNVHIFSNSQPFYSWLWWPCKQDMRDKADSVTFIITTDSTNLSASNGLLKSIEYPGNGKVRYRWETNYPISAYLVSFVVGPWTDHVTYAPLPSGKDSLLIQSLLIPTSEYYPMHLRAIEITKQLLSLYAGLLGDYPFNEEKYGYCIVGFPVFGMENQTICNMGYQSLDTTSTRYYQLLTHFMTAHELAHQWFGDAVICETWNDSWLVDGLASYMEFVALRHLESQSSADAWMEDAHAEVMSQPGGSVYIPDSLASDFTAILDYRLIYKKGASILHMLRYEIDDDSLFFMILKTYLETYKYGTATTEKFRQIAETTTGMNLTGFFDQWFYGQGYPSFDLNWFMNGDTLTIVSHQTTSTSFTPLFKTHFDLKIHSITKDTIVRLFQDSGEEMYQIYFPETIDSIEFDPVGWLIQQHTVHTGIQEKTGIHIVNIYPNPVKDLVTIELRSQYQLKEITATLFNARGQLLFQEQIRQGKTGIDLSKFSKGIYLLKINSTNHSEVWRIVKK
ncbi:MAG: T9SS type A sorting domain-containing protein [Bacteroidales bacterium]|nr:T9SS type A sorting domain-containing protein [Bacteroidales bacterium]